MKITSTPNNDLDANVENDVTKTKTSHQPKKTKTPKPKAPSNASGWLDTFLESDFVAKFDYVLDFRGTNQRKIFWIILLITNVIATGIDRLTLKLPSLLVIIGVILLLTVIYLQLVNIMRRLNDIAWSRWLTLIPAFPSALTVIATLFSIAKPTTGPTLVTGSFIMSLFSFVFIIVIGCTPSAVYEDDDEDEDDE